LIPLATVGIVGGLSFGILGASGANLGAKVGFRRRRADPTFWSQTRRGARDGVEDAAVTAGNAVAVIRVVRAPDGVVVVVKIPAEGLRRKVDSARPTEATEPEE
jgi:hypothetical protein